MCPRTKIGLEVIEGLYENFEIRLATISDHYEILAHLNENYLRDEPLSKLNGLNRRTAYFSEKILEILSQKMSLIATHTLTGEIGGVELNHESTQNEYSSSPLSHLHIERSPKRKFLNELENKCNVLERFAINRCAKIFLTSVSKKYRNQGLGTELARRSLALAKEYDFPLMKVVFTGVASMRVGEKIGFEELTRKYLCEDSAFEANSFDKNAYVKLMIYKLS